jgi:Cof subfamily protein (haloacid dehalogenase superfamily)
MIRLLVSDIDGTLVTGDKILTQPVRDAAGQLAEHGIKLVLVSSRPPHGVALFADALSLDTPRAAFNGGVFTSPAGDVLHAQLLDADTAQDALDYLHEQQIPPWLFTADEWLLTDPQGDYVAWEQKTVQMPYRTVQSFGAELGKAGKIMAASKDQAKLAACETALQARLGDRAAVHLSQTYYLDITHAQANKGEAVREAARLLGIDLAETACIGDMPNDLPMFGVAQFSIAMGQAPADMRARADYVTASNQQDGWAQAVQRFIIPHALGEA